MELSELKVGMTFSDVHALVDSASVATTKTGKIYADVILKSGSVTLKCKKWNYNAEKYLDILVAGKAVKVSGDTSMYMGEMQATLSTVEASDRSPDDFARKTKYDIETIFSQIIAIINSFEEELPKYIATKILYKYKKEFCLSPAALGMHQAWFGGLLEHTYNMISLAIPIIDFYKNVYEAKFSRDKTLFGIIMHDFGKIFEYDSSTPSFKMKPEGILLNHIMRGSLLISEIANEWYYGEDSDDAFSTPKPKNIQKKDFEREKDILIHLVAAHHGKKEYGAPVLPATLEAVLIHYIDLLDSHFTPAVELVNGKEGQVEGFSERCRVERTQYLKH